MRWTFIKTHICVLLTPGSEASLWKRWNDATLCRGQQTLSGTDESDSSSVSSVSSVCSGVIVLSCSTVLSLLSHLTFFLLVVSSSLSSPKSRALVERLLVVLDVSERRRFLYREALLFLGGIVDGDGFWSTCQSHDGHLTCLLRTEFYLGIYYTVVYFLLDAGASISLASPVTEKVRQNNKSRLQDLPLRRRL